MLKTTLLALTLMLTLASAQTVPFKQTESLPAGDYDVTRVIDADSLVITVDGVQRSIRIAEVDAPEMRPKAPYAKEATDLARGLLTDTTVYLAPTEPPIDRFGRALAYVTLEDGRDLSMVLAQAGLAELYADAPPSQFTPLYKAAVAGARSSRKGLWSSLNSPRKWRCNDFQTQAEAQSFFDAVALPGKPDVYRLDRDRDSRACQGLPTGPLLFREPPKS